MRLLTAAAAGNGASFTIKQTLNRWENNKFSFYVFGTFDSATAKLQSSPDQGTTWFDVPNSSLTAAGMVTVEFRGHNVRGVVTGGTAPAIDAILL